MKLSTSLLFIFFSIFAKAQVGNAVFSFPETKSLYGGFSVVLKMSFESKKVKDVSLTCVGCKSLEKVAGYATVWVISIEDTARYINLTATNKKGRIIAKEHIVVHAPPTPTVYLDSMTSQKMITSIPMNINLKLDKSVPLTMGFVVRNWEIQIDDKKFKGVSSKISSEVQKMMEQEKTGVVLLRIDYFSAFGQQSTKEIFEFQFE